VNEFTRAFPLEDISIRSGGDGRTVEAYAAVFGVEAPISDADGLYKEQIAPGSFDRTLQHRGTNFGVLFNHGLTIWGTPSDRGSMPIGTPLEVRADMRGLFTVTRYNKTPLADETLEAINSGAIRSQSFRGRFLRSDKNKPRGGFRAASDGSLTVVTRQEIALKEYGPAVFAAYEDAAITGVRAGFTLSPADKAVLQTLLADLAAGDDVLDTVVAQALAILGLDSALDCAQSYLSALLNVPNPDDADTDEMVSASGGDRAAVLQRLEAVATRLSAVSVTGSATPDLSGLGTGDSGDEAHSARNSEVHAYLGLRKAAREKGVL
jgi:HK97 family phage prohead protease